MTLVELIPEGLNAAETYADRGFFLITFAIVVTVVGFVATGIAIFIKQKKKH